MKLDRLTVTIRSLFATLPTARFNGFDLLPITCTWPFRNTVPLAQITRLTGVARFYLTLHFKKNIIVFTLVVS